MTKVLVTGASGLLGSTLVPYLRAHRHEVVTCSRNGSDVIADLTDPEQAYNALRKVTPEVIINLAALTNVDECELYPQRAYLCNVRIVENLVGWMKVKGVHSHLIQISSDQVYDGTGPHSEYDVTLLNYYGFSKYAGELAAACVPSTILRTNFFGRSECDHRKSISDWLVAALELGENIKVFEDVRFSPLNLSSIVKLLEIAVQRRHVGLFNLGSADGMSKADFAFMLARVLGIPTDTLHRGRSVEAVLNARRPVDMCMDSSRFEQAFGIKLPTLEQEIQLFKNYKS